VAPFSGTLFKMTGISLSFGPPEGVLIFAHPNASIETGIKNQYLRTMRSLIKICVISANIHFLKIFFTAEYYLPPTPPQGGFLAIMYLISPPRGI
jgi:hypothetical protein